MSADYRETDGFTDNTFLKTNSDATRLWNTRLKLRFDPTDKVSVITTTSYSENRIGPAGIDVVENADGGRPRPEDAVRAISTNEDGIRDGETFLQSANLNWDISENLNLLSITTYQNATQDRTLDADRSPEPGSFLDTQDDTTTFTQELRLSYQSTRLRSTLGAYYAGIDGDFNSLNVLSLPPFLPLPPELRVIQDVASESEIDNYALYVDGEYQITSDLELLFGLRYDHEDTLEEGTVFQDFNFIPPGLEGLLGGQIGETENFFEASFDAWLPKAGVRWTPEDNWTLAFVVQRAYRAGGAVRNQLTQELVPFDPEYLWNYELASRATFLDNRLSWFTNVYYSDWTDQQVAQPLPPPQDFVSITVNAGESELYGLETELKYNLTSELSVYGSAAFTYARFIEFEEFDGNRFPNAPRTSANAGIDYYGARGIFGGIDITYRSEVFGSPENSDDFTGDSYLLVNARIGYQVTDRLQITALARNIFEDEFFLSLNTTRPPGSAVLGDPRTVAVRMDLSY